MAKQTEPNHFAPFWHMDCLGTLAVLALGFNKRQQERLARKFELTDEEGCGDPVHVLQALHEGCTSHGMERLKRIVCQADIVVCIMSMNSHGAVHVAKSVCKRTGKKLLLTKETGTRSLRACLAIHTPGASLS